MCVSVREEARMSELKTGKTNREENMKESARERFCTTCVLSVCGLIKERLHVSTNACGR